jgi:hypothetical protein
MAKTPSAQKPRVCWSCRWYYELYSGNTCIYWVKPVEPDHTCKSWCGPEYRWPIPEDKRDRYLGAD